MRLSAASQRALALRFARQRTGTGTGTGSGSGLVLRVGAQRGVSLLELLVALAIFAVISAAAYAGLGAVLDTRSALSHEALRLRELQLAWSIIERDIEQIAPRSVRDEFGLRRAALEAGGDPSALIRMTRGGWDNPLRQPRATLQRLGYRLQQQQLWRDHWTVLDRGVNQPPQQQLLIDGVTEVRLRFLDAGGAWQTRWPPVRASSGRDTDPDGLQRLRLMPRALEFRITLRDWGEITRLLRLADAL